MIKIYISYSYKENYHFVDAVEFEGIEVTKELEEKKKEINQKIIDYSKNLNKILANHFNVDESQIDIDVNDIDLM